MEFRPNRAQQTRGRQFHQHLKTIQFPRVFT